MKHRVATALLLVVAILIPSLSYTRFETRQNDVLLSFNGAFKIDTFGGFNTSLFNKNNIGNQIWYMRHTLDFNLGLAYGQEQFDSSIINSKFNLRNKGIWGNPESITRTVESTIKDVDVVEGAHRHAIARHIFWMREGWLEFDLSHFLGLSFLNKHSFKLGLFPFALGRGIALGAAYAVGPELLGFYTDGAVDQFAPGGLLHGDILENTLSYDFYAATLLNRSTSIGETAADILGQQYGRRETPQRGSGKINFVVASRLNWDVFKHDTYGRLHVEPYVLYNKDPEQKVQFRGDASSQLGTLGMAAEYTQDIFEFGFDYAFNLGKQSVKGWDRNSFTKENRNGYAAFVNTHILDQNGNKVPNVKGSAAQKLINDSYDPGMQDESKNGKTIGTVDGDVGFVTGPVTLVNSETRFRNPYTNTYEGWMFVVDGGIWAYKKDLFLAASAWIASGDSNPNEETKDQQYSGFIPLQEIYSGTRVETAFFGKITRPLSAPTTNQAPSRFASVTDGFTNLVSCGFSAKYEPQGVKTPYRIFANGLAYWQEKPTNKFDAKSGKELDALASTFLGVELNLFSHWYVVKDLKVFFVGSVFFPGAHFRQIKGKPLNPAQQRQLDRLDRIDFDETRIPNFGADTAYTFDLGVEYRF